MAATRRGKEDRHAGNLPLEGGRLCLDFINTLDWRGAPEPIERLRNYGDLLAWGGHAGLLTPQAAAELREAAALRPDAAREALRRAVTLREALHALFLGSPGTGGALAVLNRELTPAAAPWRVAPTGSGWRWEGPETLAGLLPPIAWSAAELLVSPERSRVKPCGDATCGWLFLDTSRNSTRRWCSMAACGNRAKARRHYRRQHEEAGAYVAGAPRTED